MLPLCRYLGCMTSLDGKPCDTYFPEGSEELDPLQRRQKLLVAMQEVVKRYVDLTFQGLKEHGATGRTVNSRQKKRPATSDTGGTVNRGQKKRPATSDTGGTVSS